MRASGLTVSTGADGSTELRVKLDESSICYARELYDSFRDTEVEIEIKKFRRRRSLDANAYFWVLVGKLAEKLRQSPLEIYRHYIEQAGVFRAVDISEVAVQTLVHSWGLHGKGWICDVLDYGRHEDTRLVRLYYGSSVYNGKQMSALIDSIVEDCKEQGIETMTPDEIARMKARWADD